MKNLAEKIEEQNKKLAENKETVALARETLLAMKDLNASLTAMLQNS